MSLQTFSSFPGGAINAHIAEELLLIAKKSVVFQQIGEKAKMPPGEGKTFQFNRYNRLSLPLVPLTEGAAPSSTNMSLTTVQAVADQWGAFVALSDVAQLTIKHPLLEVAMQLLGYQAAELVDREIIKVLLNGTQVQYGGTAASRAGLSAASSMYLNDLAVQQMVATLREGGAHEYEGSNFLGVLDPAMEQDISQNSNNSFTLAAAYSNVKVLLNGEIGTWRGIRWMRSNFIPSLQTTAASSLSLTAAAGGSAATGTYYLVAEYVSSDTGFVTQVSAPSSISTTGSQNTINFTAPTATGYQYNIGIGSASSGPFYLGASAIAAAATGAVTAAPTSGTQVQLPGVSGAANKVHFGWVFGRQAFCTVDLMNLTTYVSSPMATVYDPLVQQRTVGYKLMFKPVIQNDSFMIRFEGLSSFT